MHNNDNTCPINKANHNLYTNTNLLSFLNTSNYQVYNRQVAKQLKSINAAILLSELINRFEYHEERNELIVHEKHGIGWFYHTIEHVEDRTGMSRDEQDQAIKILKNSQVIETQVFGLPAKRHFRVNVEKIYNLFTFSKNISSLRKIHKLDCGNSANWNEENPQTAHYSRRTQEKNPYKKTTTTIEKDVVVVHNSKENIEKSEHLADDLITEHAETLKMCLDKKAEEWGKNWQLPLNLFINLIRKHGDSFVLDQTAYMLAQHQQAILDQKIIGSKKKTKPIDKVESYLKLACVKNYAMSNYSGPIT